MKRLEGKVALITGAGQGIGRSTAIKFASEGAVVVACDVREEHIHDTVDLCRSSGAKALGLVMPISYVALDSMSARKLRRRITRRRWTRACPNFCVNGSDFN